MSDRGGSADWERLYQEKLNQVGWTSGGGWDLTDDEVEEVLRVSGISPPAGQQQDRPAIIGPGMKHIIETVSSWLDNAVALNYQKQPLAQDWARVAKLAEEIGELREAALGQPADARGAAHLADLEIAAGRSVSALIAYTGQNPRKGVTGTQDDMLGELADVACTALFALQHFTQDVETTAGVVEAALVKALNRVTGTTPGVKNSPGSTRE